MEKTFVDHFSTSDAPEQKLYQTTKGLKGHAKGDDVYTKRTLERPLEDI